MHRFFAVGTCDQGFWAFTKVSLGLVKLDKFEAAFKWARYSLLQTLLDVLLVLFQVHRLSVHVTVLFGTDNGQLVPMVQQHLVEPPGLLLDLAARADRTAAHLIPPLFETVFASHRSLALWADLRLVREAEAYQALKVLIHYAVWPGHRRDVLASILRVQAHRIFRTP